ncbi:MAG: hypothetical protein NTV43_00485 [Methylococcales bacterium]|nr:hypothetical protein [Methylococcales bacterium]
MSDVLKIISDISSIISLVGTGFSLKIWYSMKRRERFNEQRIKILLKMPAILIELPCEIERKHLTRSELQGLLGILPRFQVQYALSFTNTTQYFAKLKAAQDDKDTTSIEIICEEDEVAQFDLVKIKKQCRHKLNGEDNWIECTTNEIS